MSNDFSLKQFNIRQERAAMKVGTDGLLLGAWADGVGLILDIGTGTGLIALMMAQRFSGAIVDAIDIDPDAALQAKENVEDSPFADRVTVICTSLQEFDIAKRYDAIVCNPPYFTQSLLPPDSKRTLARHAVALPFDELFRHSSRLLANGGVFSIIVPFDVELKIMVSAAVNGFFLVRRCTVSTTPSKSPRRLLMAFALAPQPVNDERGTIHASNSEYSEWYKKLTCDFLLKL